jgi:hypothetical protein
MSDSNKRLSEQRGLGSAPVSYRYHARNILGHPVAMVQGLLQSKFLCLWILFICLQQLRRASIDSPLDGNAVTQHGTWLSQPIGRDPWEIFGNCVLTMLLCVWNALHLNPACEERTLARSGRLFRFWYNGT